MNMFLKKSYLTIDFKEHWLQIGINLEAGLVTSQAALFHGLIFLPAPPSVFCGSQAGFFFFSFQCFLGSLLHLTLVSVWKLLFFPPPQLVPPIPHLTHAFLLPN